ncbi:hypothetical protein NPIL_237571 [Nephila pilipes]|uniref:Uncharacterized protein n=1 Tax=Nephila pilipes TaxID=299642 RepID=A0A8X6QZ92_NEPPI|nr:hypothetical protein NPIL_237571 [Nephila pilipes]
MDLICECLCLQLNCQSSFQSLQVRIIHEFMAPIPNIIHLEPIHLCSSLRLNLMIRLEISAFRKRQLNCWVPDQKKNLLAKRIYFYWYSNRGKEFVQNFDEDEGLVYCLDIPGFICKFNITYDKDEWRLPIDLSKRNPKTLLIHRGS